MRLVLDTNIVVSGLIWGGVPRHLLELGRDGRITFFTSSVLLDELADVLEKEKFADLLSSQGITPAFLMQRYGMLAKLVKPQPIEWTVRDVDDDVVIATALAAKTDIIPLATVIYWCCIPGKGYRFLMRLIPCSMF